jgi:hypothetical protein
MGNITKAMFVSTVEAIKQQMAYDIDQQYSLSTVLKVETSQFPLYDNSILIKALILLLQIYFPKEEGFCEIEHYCFDLNFGKISETEYMSIDKLWELLTSSYEPMVSTHPLIDDETGFLKFYK